MFPVEILFRPRQTSADSAQAQPLTSARTKHGSVLASSAVNLRRLPAHLEPILPLCDSCDS